MMKSDEYWGIRAVKRTAKYERKAHSAANSIARVYSAMQSYLTDECKSVFSNFSVGISETQAKMLLNDIQSPELQKLLKKMVAKAKDPQLKQALQKQLESPAYRARMLRLEQLMQQVDDMAETAGRKDIVIARKAYIDVANTAYNTTMQDLQAGMEQISEFATLPKKRIDEILSTNWSGRHYSRRIWNNTGELAEVLKNELTVGFACGKSSAKMSRIIADRFHTTQSNAARLIRTESNYVANQAELESYKAMSIKQYRFLATLDLRTSKLCQQQDGKIYSVEDAKSGVNLPPLHPYCRSTTIPLVDVTVDSKRFARDSEGKNVKVSRGMTYDGWKEKFVDTVDESGIIEVRGDDSVGVVGMQRVKRGNEVLARMPKTQLNRIAKSFKRQGGIIQRDQRTDEYLSSRHAEAITLNDKTILLTQKPSRSSVFEELIHATQYRKGENDGSYKARLTCEIAAQEKLIKNAKAYKLTESEIIQTQKALKIYIAELEQHDKNGGE